MHDPVPWRDDLDVFKRLLCPFDEVETVFVAAVFDGAVLRKRVGVEACKLHGQRVVHDQLRLYDGVDLGRVATHVGNRIPQTGQVHQRGLAQDVVAHHTRGEPGEVQVAFAFDQLFE